jgi:hypothetical protein
MKKFTIIAVALLLPMMVWGQAQIDTKKMKISDFTQKITKVVLSGNPLHDACLKSEVEAKWTVSPFEFCTLAEFEQLKSNANYYFLLTTKGQFKKESEPGLAFLTLVKGGADSAQGIDKMLEIVTFPYASAEQPSGREMVFLPTFLDIIQNYALDSMERDIDAYTGLPNYSMNITKSGSMTLVFSETDLSSEVTPELRNACFDSEVLVLDEESADEYVSPETSNTLVSYVAVPTDAKPGSYCYKMLLDPQTSKLYYFRKHKISKKWGPGFLAEDIKRVTAPRTKK